MAIEDELLASMFKGMRGGAKKYGSDMAGHMPLLYTLGRLLAPCGDLVELGIGGGYSTVALLAGALSGGGRLYSYDVDPACRARALETIGLLPNDARLGIWTFWAKDSIAAAADFKDGSVSLMFLDTVHTLEATRRELQAWLPKLHPRGVISGHDYMLAGAGVQAAVLEFQKLHPGRFHLDALPHDQGFFILWPE